MALRTLNVSFGGAGIGEPEEFSLLSTDDTDTLEINITFVEPGKISDIHALFPEGATFNVELDWNGQNTHKGDIFTKTSTPYVGLSGRSFLAGQTLKLTIDDGANGPKALTGSIQAHIAG